MEELRKKLESLGEEDRKLVFKLTEERLQETIITFNEQKARLAEIFKFSIPILGALLYQIFTLSEKCKCYKSYIIGILILVLFTVGILIWSVILYLPSGISVKGKQASKVLSDYEPEKNLLVSLIIQYERSIEYNADKLIKRSDHLKALTISILAIGSIAVIVYALAFAI